MRRGILVVSGAVVATGASLALGGIAYAARDTQLPPEATASMVGFLTWTIFSGGALAMTQKAAEYWPWFQEQGPSTKIALQTIIVALVTALGTIVLNYVPADALRAVDPYLASIINIVATFFLSSLTHAATKRSGHGAFATASIQGEPPQIRRD